MSIHSRFRLAAKNVWMQEVWGGLPTPVSQKLWRPLSLYSSYAYTCWHVWPGDSWRHHLSCISRVRTTSRTHCLPNISLRLSRSCNRHTSRYPRSVLLPLCDPHWADVLELALAGNIDTNKLIDVLGRFGCKEIPTTDMLVRLVRQIAQYEFVSKPMAPLSAISSGVPENHRACWWEKTINELYQLYVPLSCS